jgi:hypothetical protein
MESGITCRHNMQKIFYFSETYLGNGVKSVVIANIVDENGALAKVGTVTTNSIILASATQVNTDHPGNPPIQGNASIQILNCIPLTTGGFTVVVNVLWNSPIYFRISGVMYAPGIPSVQAF